MFKFDLGDLWHLTLFSTDLDILDFTEAIGAQDLL